MQKTFTCEVVAASNKRFEVTYQSTQHKEKDIFDKPFNVIKEVKLCDYVLALGQLRERSVWYELMAAVDNNSLDSWEQYWKQKPLDTSNLHPVFADIFNSIANATNPQAIQNQLEDVANISQQGNQC